MKTAFKNKSRAIIASLLVTAFFLLNHFVYLDHAASEIPIIQSYTDSPVDMNELFLWEENKPSYFNPIRKVQFVYSDRNTEESVIEQAESIFSSKMQPLVGDPYKYYIDFYSDGFGRPQVGYTYANLIFFILQYFIVGAFVFVIFKPEKSNK